MLSVEIKINGNMIGHIYARNTTPTTKAVGLNLYTSEYYKPELRSVVKGEITHEREAGIEKLVGKILLEVSKI